MSNDSITEKVSVNMNTATLSSIDLLVDSGYYSNRSDFINQAVRETLRQHNRDIDRIVGKHTEDAKSGSIWFFGVYKLTQNELERLHNARRIDSTLNQPLKSGIMAEKLHNEGQQVTFTGYGMLSIAKDCDEQMLFDTVSSIKIRGRVNCSDSIKRHYGLK